jgi:flagellar basal-body rod protein FlgG
MSGEIYMAAAGALAYEKRLEVVANNLANANTAGFKRDEVSFQAYMLSAEGAPQAVSPPFPDVSDAAAFWIEARGRTDFSAGAHQPTGNRFDLALNGEGFFSVQSPEGVLFTRRGSFTLDAEGRLITAEGYPVLGDGGEIRLDRRDSLDFTVGEEGTVSAKGAALGRLRIAAFRPQDLVKAGDGYFKPNAEAVEAPAPAARIAQGFLEMSNVEAVRSMIEMIEILRGYESFQRVMRSADEADSKSIAEVGRSA